MICERCGYDFTEIEQFNPRYCIKCGLKLEGKKETEPKVTVLSIEDVCNILQLKRASVYQYVHKGKLPYFKVGGKLRFNVKDIEKLRGLEREN